MARHRVHRGATKRRISGYRTPLCDAGADFIAEVGEVLEGVGVHGAFPSDFDGGGEGAVTEGQPAARPRFTGGAAAPTLSA